MEEDTTKGYKEFGGRGIIPVDGETESLDFSKSFHLRSLDGEAASPEDESASIYTDKMHQNEKEEYMKKNPSGNFAVDYRWHSHPGGSWKKFEDEDNSKWLPSDEFDQQQMNKRHSNTISGGTVGGRREEVKDFGFGPSEQDIKNAKSKFKESQERKITGTDGYYLTTKNFVIHKKQNVVFYYNQDTQTSIKNYSAKMSLENFYNLKK